VLHYLRITAHQDNIFGIFKLHGAEKESLSSDSVLRIHDDHIRQLLQRKVKEKPWCGVMCAVQEATACKLVRRAEADLQCPATFRCENTLAALDTDVVEPPTTAIRVTASTIRAPIIMTP
jgi:hypothetical protein